MNVLKYVKYVSKNENKDLFFDKCELVHNVDILHISFPISNWKTYLPSHHLTFKIESHFGMFLHKRFITLTLIEQK